MSETDDTDVLLLIPPNFFLVPSSGSEESLLESSRTVVHKPVSCTTHVIGRLVDQVQSLESRLESLELDTSKTFSTISSSRYRKNENYDSSLDRKYFTFPRRRRRKIRRDSKRDISLTSFESSTFKFKREPRSIEIINVSPTMDSDISSIVSTPSKKNDKLLLNEIDEFLTKVESYESPESKFKKINPDVIKATGNYIAQKQDSQSADEIELPSGRKVSSHILDKYIYLVKNRQEQLENKASTSNLINESDSSYNSFQKKSFLKSPSRRKLNFPEQDVQPTSTPKQNIENTNYSETFRPSCNKIYDRATKVLEEYRSQINNRNQNPEELTCQKDEFKMPQMKPFTSDTKGFKLDSLDTELLSLSELWGEKEGNKLESLKLEEERLKREHCETMIQQLQKKILDQQEKLAVAMRVDKSKDAAIAKLREAWLKLTSSLDRAEERHKGALEKMVREVENFKCVACDAQKKTSHFETELYKALDLAHDYQEKCKQLTTEKNELQEDMDRIVSLKEETIALKEKEIETLKENYDTVMRLNKQSTDCVKNLEQDLEKEKSEHQVTMKRIEELNSKIQSISEEASLLSQEKDIHKNKVNEERSRCNILERQLCDLQNQNSEVLKKCSALESECESLRRQLEIQKCDLKSHYQQQLEAAVLGKLQQFQVQLERAQRDLEAAAAHREAQAADHHQHQLARLEQQHRLEIEVLEEKQKEEIKLYRLQLAQASEKIELLESKVDSWRRRRGQLAAQLHGVMQAQWQQALNILTRPHTHPPGTGTGTAHTGASFEKPDKDISFNLDTLSDAEMQNYLKMLLTKPPNFDVNEHSPESHYTDEPTSDRPDKSRKDKVKRSLSNKPPWKS